MARSGFTAMNFRSPSPGRIGMGAAAPAVEGGCAAAISVPCGRGSACSGARTPRFAGHSPPFSVLGEPGWAVCLRATLGPEERISLRVGEGQGEEWVRGNEPQESITRTDRSGDRRANRGRWWCGFYYCTLALYIVLLVLPRYSSCASASSTVSASSCLLSVRS